MRKCWLEKPDERPTFENLHKYFYNKLASCDDYLAMVDEKPEYDVFDDVSDDNGQDSSEIATSVGYATQIQSNPPAVTLGLKTRNNTYVDMESTKKQVCNSLFQIALPFYTALGCNIQHILICLDIFIVVIPSS